MSGEKPAPTAAKVAAARYWFSGADPLREPSMGPTTRVHVAVLLAALDAAEARAAAAEKERDDAEVFAHGSVRMVRERLATAERERDDANRRATAAEKSIDRARKFIDAHGLAGGLGGHYSLREVIKYQMERLATAERERDEARAALKPGAIVVSDSPETVERVARALAVSDGYASDASRELVSTFLADARAVLAALRESRP